MCLPSIKQNYVILKALSRESFEDVRNAVKDML